MAEEFDKNTVKLMKILDIIETQQLTEERKNELVAEAYKLRNQCAQYLNKEKNELEQMFGQITFERIQ
ncbi:Exonuclease_VII [Hexamita inflata]|uniref:Small subunit superfamily n=1 Tax=Hexamita inflata TaxID=28002 RepID=A0AA86NPK0_9EUKA|nr:Exonuclease VII [Hexamita inflata]